MAMSLKNSSESYSQCETEIPDTESDIPSEQNFCDDNCVCDRCSLLRTEINETDIKNRAMCRPTQIINQTLNSLLNQNRVIDFHYSEGLEGNMKTELCLSKENISYQQEDKKEKDTEIPSDFIAEKESREFSGDFTTEKEGREFFIDFNAEMESREFSSDLNAEKDSREFPSDFNAEKQGREYSSDFSAQKEGREFSSEFNAGNEGREFSRNFHAELVGRGFSDDFNAEKEHKEFSSDCSAIIEGSTDTALETYDFSNFVDSRRTRRSSKRKRDIEDFCPVCGVTVRCTELASHFEKEVENLSKISKNIKKTRIEENQGISTTYVQVKSNRENRHAAKVAKFSVRQRNEVYCPVCHFRLTGTQDEINSHVLSCINEEEEYEEINVLDNYDGANADDENSFEEYEFGDETRVRVISMIPGGYRALQGDSLRPRRTCDEDDGDLNVDVDDTLTYGNPQYTELDVIHNETDAGNKEELDQLRKAVLMDPSAERHVLESRKWVNNSGENVNPEGSCSSEEKIEAIAGHEALKVLKTENIEEQESCVNKEVDHIVLSLKEKIKDLEENTNVKCLICLEPYTKPVVSTTCWHVHCEECWLMTMGVKKLCPQCNMIVFPSDLRRIYL